ncbi:hypothetical protein AB0H03_17540 [Streptomyces sparsogenes]|uniref:hypothetical protein n=1 Tax=Streptomyces sparsogenes TaxID=67365 RepID=UPI0033DAA27F
MTHAYEASHQLAKALARLAEEYPTDPDIEEQLALRFGDGDAPGYGFPEPVTLRPGQLAWLAQLVERELDTARNAHSDGDGSCAHCEGTGAARPTGSVTHVVAWFPGDLLSNNPEMSRWEVYTADGWETRSAGDWLTGDEDAEEAVATDPDATAEQLQPVVAKMLAPAGPIRLTPGTFTIDSVGEPGSPSFQTGPWTYPMFKVTTLVPHHPVIPEPPSPGSV